MNFEQINTKTTYGFIRTGAAVLVVLLLTFPVNLLARETPENAFTGYGVGGEDPSAEVSGKDPEIQDLAQQLKEQREIIDDLQSKVNAYESKIQTKRNEALTIKNQLSTLEDTIAQTKLQLELKRAEIIKLNVQIKETENNIEQKNKEIAIQKERLGEFIRVLFQNDQKSYLEILLSDNAFNDFFDQQQYLVTIEGDLHLVIEKVKAFKEKLETDKKELEAQHADLESLRDGLTEKQLSLEENITAKNVILEATQADEGKFQQLLQQVRAEQAQINADVVNLERQLRARLEESGDKTLSSLSGQQFIWPVPGRTITATFHDPDYPFRRYFEHPAIDIRAPQGTPIKAIASGYVSQAHDGGLGYSYISIIHADGLSSVYGHVSCILVAQDEFVVQGQVIGCSGATPGTSGAGNLTTGPHLHLEVRLNGIPVNPENYLP